MATRQPEASKARIARLSFSIFCLIFVRQKSFCVDGQRRLTDNQWPGTKPLHVQYAERGGHADILPTYLMDAWYRVAVFGTYKEHGLLSGTDSAIRAEINLVRP